jgi:hypothetical protein
VEFILEWKTWFKKRIGLSIISIVSSGLTFWADGVYLVKTGVGGRWGKGLFPAKARCGARTNRGSGLTRGGILLREKKSFAPVEP